MDNIKSRHLYLDGWRGFAIIGVLIGHFYPLPFINLGRFGVELFFVLSGRLMAEILFEKQLPLLLFLKRRISRVWPALFVFLLVTWAIFDIVIESFNATYLSLITCLTFTYNYLTIGRSPVFDHIWSLCVEEHVYLALALIAFLTRKYYLKPVTILLAIALLAMGNGIFQSIYLGHGYYDVYRRTDVRGASIIFSAATYLIIKDKKFISPAWLSPVLLLFSGALNLSWFPDTIKYTIGTALLAISISAIQTSSNIFLNILENKWIRIFGLISFSLYLWQQPMYNLIGEYRRMYLFAAVFVMAFLSYKTVEMPFRKFLNSRWAAQRD